ncbi:MAG: MFS transporter [Hyphomicrobiales bacterium]
MIAMTAFSIDIMLPAFPAIADALGVTVANDRQEIITAYMIGFAAGQIVYGPVSDTFGRRAVAFFGFAIFVVATLAAAYAGSFTALLLARVGQGIGAAAPRIMALAIVRDRFSGDRMARVMSLVMMVFIVVPVVAPSIGQMILLFAPGAGCSASCCFSALPSASGPSCACPRRWRRSTAGRSASARSSTPCGPPSPRARRLAMAPAWASSSAP